MYLRYGTGSHIACRLALSAIGLALFSATCGAAIGAEVQKRPPPPRREGPPAANRDSLKRSAQRPADRPQKGVPEVNDERASPGYTLINPMKHTRAYLIDMDGKVINIWSCGTEPALSAYLLENGHLLRPAALEGEELPFRASGDGGRIQEFTWDGDLVWDFKFVNPNGFPHHDVAPLPNGNVLIIAWDRKTKEEAIARGRRPTSTNDFYNSDSIIEIKPTGKKTGEIVWQWHAWDHLVQDFDKSKPNYGRVAGHPELIDVNFGTDTVAEMMNQKEGMEKLRSIGYVGGAVPRERNGTGMPNSRDLTHFNSVAYNPDTDQILLSSRSFNEIWIIDHGTTTAEAAGHTGGKRGKGGDLLYRWGNPRSYRAGTALDQRLFSQHNAHWIAKGLPGEGNILIFNNGEGRPDGEYSSVDEIVPTVDEQGTYVREGTRPYGPSAPAWRYAADDKTDFFSLLLSGAKRLPNGNTLICKGNEGEVFEVTSSGETVWKYKNPVRQARRSAGLAALDKMPPLGDVLPEFLEEELGMTLEQQQSLDKLEKECAATLDQLLTEEQKRKLEAVASGDILPIYRPGVIMSRSLQNRLLLTQDKKDQIVELQRRADNTLGSILEKGQMRKLSIAKNSGWGGPDELQSRGAQVPSRNGQGGGQPKQRPGGPVAGGGGPNAREFPKGPGNVAKGRGQGSMTAQPPGPPCALFQCLRYAADYPGLAGRDLHSGIPFARAYAEIERESNESLRADPSAPR